MTEQENVRNEVFNRENMKSQIMRPTSERMRNELGFEIPLVETPLPSNGKVYSESHPFHGKDFINIYAMTTKQEDILTNRSLVKRGTVLTHLIQSSLEDQRVDAKELIVGDRNAIMVALRISGYGSEYNQKFLTQPL